MWSSATFGISTARFAKYSNPMPGEGINHIEGLGSGADFDIPSPLPPGRMAWGYVCKSRGGAGIGDWLGGGGGGSRPSTCGHLQFRGPGGTWSLLVAYINDSRGRMPAAIVQQSKIYYHIAIIFHVDIVQAMDEVFHVLLAQNVAI